MPSYRRSAPLCMALLLSCIANADANCYILKDRSGKTLSYGNSAPFSLSWPDVSAEQRASQKRGEHLIILSMSDCPEVGATSTNASIEAADTSGYVPDNKAAMEGLAARYQGPQMKLGPGEFWGPTSGGSGDASGGGSSGNKDVHVDGHWRNTQGGGRTWVDEHMRSRPSQ